MLKWLGTRDDPWNIMDEEMLPLLQTIWDAVYGDKVPYKFFGGDKDKVAKLVRAHILFPSTC